MGNVVLYMSMSVDGFITGPDDSVDHGLGVDGERLHDWIQFPAGGEIRVGTWRSPSPAVWSKLLKLVGTA